MKRQFVVNVTDQTFETEVLKRSLEVPVVVDFWASWCGPCRMLGPLLEKLAEEARGEWILAKCDTDQNPASAQRYGIQGIPAVKAFVEGRLVDEFVGALPEVEVRRWLQRIVPGEAERLWKEARSLEERGELRRAEALYREAFGKDSNHAGVRLGLARAAHRQGNVTEARRLLKETDIGSREDLRAELASLRIVLEGAEHGDLPRLERRVTDHPEDLDARYSLAMALAAANRHEDALEHLLRIVSKDRSFRDDGARKAMLDIFEAVGNRSPIAERWRERLASVLYR